VEEGGWIRAFSGVTSLWINDGDWFALGASEVSLAHFRELSLTLKSLHLGPILLPCPGLFDFVLSFPLLEDFSLAGYNDPQFDVDGNRPLDEPQTVIPSTSPPLTGSLGFHLRGGAGNAARQLLDLPNGLHFRKLSLSWYHETDLWWMTELVTRCSHTLEFLDITHINGQTLVHICVRTNNLTLFQACSDPSSYLSTATRLRDLIFQPGSQRVKWITMALQTITPEHRDLRRISIQVHYAFIYYGMGFREFIGEVACREWLDLDRLLVQLWESRSIRPRVGSRGMEWDSTLQFIGCLLPEITKRGIVDPV